MPANKKRKREDGSAGPAGKRYKYLYGKYAADYRGKAIARVGGRGTDGSIAYWGADFKNANAEQRRRRQLMRYAGKGDYRTALKWGSRGLGALAGGALGYSSGGAAGARAGAGTGYDLGAGFSKWAGWGDYTGAQSGLVKNDIMLPPNQRQASVNAGRDGGIVEFAHTEFIQNVSVTATGAGSTPFNIQSFSLNPGDEGTFPFMSQLASNFTLYDLEGLIFQFKPTSGETGGTGSNSLGKVVMCTDYDPDALPFTNSQAMENYQGASSCKPSCGMLHGVETAPAARFSNQLYIRTGHSAPGPSSSGKDKVQTDLGLFQVATEGISVGAAGTFIVGELWVTYKVRLTRPGLAATQAAVGTNMDSFTVIPNNAVSLYDSKAIVDLPPVPNVAADIGILYAASSNNLGMELLGVDRGAGATGLRFTWPKNVVHGLYRISISGLTTNFDATTDAPFQYASSMVGCEAGVAFGSRNLPGGAVAPNFTTVDGFPTALGRVAVTAGGQMSMYVDVAVLAPDSSQASIELHSGGGSYLTSAGVYALTISVQELPYGQRNTSRTE